MPGAFLAEFELYVMLAIARLGDDAYGALIRQEIESRTGRPVSIGALYTTLARLEDKGLVSLRTATPEPGQRGRARRYCKLTPRGTDALRHSATMLAKMMRGLGLAGGRAR
ncbi:MAG TPA: helix-turn-helix transcriptional regulator [Vicinamibacterales bacterium]|nr:helix-turn-helix transcriptional regulator [Vicinamibacterales bacterium]